MAKRIHFLHYLAVEDEAQATGLRFEPRGDVVVVSETYAFPEYEQEWSSPREMSLAEARALWVKLIKSGDFEHVK